MMEEMYDPGQGAIGDQILHKKTCILVREWSKQVRLAMPCSLPVSVCRLASPRIISLDFGCGLGTCCPGWILLLQQEDPPAAPGGSCCCAGGSSCCSRRILLLHQGILLAQQKDPCAAPGGSPCCNRAPCPGSIVSSIIRGVLIQMKPYPIPCKTLADRKTYMLTIKFKPVPMVPRTHPIKMSLLRPFYTILPPILEPIASPTT